jgi:hypothetical protein
MPPFPLRSSALRTHFMESPWQSQLLHKVGVLGMSDNLGLHISVIDDKVWTRL